MMAGTVLLWPTTRTLLPPARTAAATALAWLAVSSPACTMTGVSLSPRRQKGRRIARAAELRRDDGVEARLGQRNRQLLGARLAGHAERDVTGRRVGLFGVPDEHDDLGMVSGGYRDERHREREEQRAVVGA